MLPGRMAILNGWVCPADFMMDSGPDVLPLVVGKSSGTVQPVKLSQ